MSANVGRINKGTKHDIEAGRDRTASAVAAETGMTWVTDLSHFIDETGKVPSRIPGPARGQAQYLTAIVVAATSAADNDGHAGRPVPCRRRPGHRACPGVLEYRLWAEERVTWAWPHCGDYGIILNWRSSVWDHRYVQPIH